MLALIRSLFVREYSNVYFDNLHSFVVLSRRVYYRKRLRLMFDKEFGFEIGLKPVISYSPSYPGSADRVEVINLSNAKTVGVFFI